MIVPYNQWLDTIGGTLTVTKIYQGMAYAAPSKFELDREVRKAYEEYKKGEPCISKNS